jgi:hypothetical protein
MRRAGVQVGPMYQRLKDAIAELRLRRSLRRWDRAAGDVRTMPLSDLRRTARRARALRARLDAVLAGGEARLARRLAPGRAIRRPPGSDWAWRPAAWREPVSPATATGVAISTPLGPDAALHHDCPLSEVTLRQAAADALAPHAVEIEVYGFAGSYLSLAVDLPSAAAAGLTRRHILRVEAELSFESPLGVVARLNLLDGPNTEQLLQKLPADGPVSVAEFDLFYAGFGDGRIEKLWLDLIFTDPGMNRIRVGDLTFSRRPRAQL